MIPAIGYSMCAADHGRLNSTADRTSLATTWSPEAQPTAVEIDLDCSNRSLETLRDLAGERVTLHAVTLSDDAHTPSETALCRLTDLARQSGAQAVIARLESAPVAPAAASRTAEPNGTKAHAAHLASLAWKAETANLSQQVEAVQTRLGEIPFYLESTVEAEWFKRNSHGKRVLRKVLAGTGCGWFLDVTAVYVAAMNSAQDAADLIEEVLPSTDHVQLRLTGVYFDEQAERWIASDAHPIPEAVFELYAFVLEVALEKVDAVFVRQEPADAIQLNSEGEIQTVREIAEGVSAIV
jgi:uncharacterized protein (UPF0276 family)